MAAFVVVAAAAPLSAQNVRSVRLAGTVNQWNTQSDEFALKPVGDSRYELVRRWPAGSYEFKFVFDGSWDRHLGSVGEDRLGQPGENIMLSIPQSGDYAIVLDLAAKTWSLERRPSEKPLSSFLIRYLEPGLYQLDGRLCRGRRDSDYASLNYEWRIHPTDKARLVFKEPGSYHQPLVEVNESGRFDIRLSVDDDETVDTKIVGAHLSDGPPFSYEYKDGRIAPGPRSTDDGLVSFVFDPTAHPNWPAGTVPERVEIVGDFNDWRPGYAPMTPIGDGGLFRAEMQLPEGLHHYKYEVNGCIRLDDPQSDRAYREGNGAGGFDSGVLVGPDAARFGPARPNDIECAAAQHRPASPAYLTRMGDTLYRFNLKTLADDADGVAIRFKRSGQTVPMRKEASRQGFDLWSATCRTDLPDPTYSFELRDASARWMLDDRGCVALTESSPARAVVPFLGKTPMEFKTPEWAQRAVWYQIFPERFDNGDESNDPPRTVPWTHPWFEPYDGAGADDPRRRFMEEGDFYEFIFDRRYGGDLQGVRRRLDYLRNLGINAIYLNPIFHAESLHKYDASFYRHIDDAFGVAGSLEGIRGETEDPATWKWSDSDRVFLDLLREAHDKGFKVIIDGVFNHVGRDFWAFQDVLKNKEKSRYAGWFDIVSWQPFHYKAWDRDDGSLPRLKHDDALGLAQPVRELIFAVTRRWMDPNGDGDPADGIDGWRLDVASDINQNFWTDWRQCVKSVNPDAFIVAELWEESRSWLDGRTFDAVMNYPFARATQRFFINEKKATTPSQFDAELKQILGWYAPQVNLVLQNLFGSHDTDRVASMFMNPDLEYDKANRLQDNGPQYNPNQPTQECYDRLKALVTFQMTYLGAPMVYYGDEVGMFGADDPSCRKPMLWKDRMPYVSPEDVIREDVFDHHRRMIAVRNTFEPLQLGSYETLEVNDQQRVYAFARTLGGRSIVAVFNDGREPFALKIASPWPDGSAVFRLDDPKECEVVDPPAADGSGRPFVRARNALAPSARVENGRLVGGELRPRSAAVFATQP